MITDMASYLRFYPGGDQRTWLPWLEQSADQYAALLRETPADWLTRRVETIDCPALRSPAGACS